MRTHNPVMPAIGGSRTQLVVKMRFGKIFDLTASWSVFLLLQYTILHIYSLVYCTRIRHPWSKVGAGVKSIIARPWQSHGPMTNMPWIFFMPRQVGSRKSHGDKCPRCTESTPLHHGTAVSLPRSLMTARESPWTPMKYREPP